MLLGTKQRSRRTYTKKSSSCSRAWVRYFLVTFLCFLPCAHNTFTGGGWGSTSGPGGRWRSLGQASGWGVSPLRAPFLCERTQAWEPSVRPLQINPLRVTSCPLWSWRQMKRALRTRQRPPAPLENTAPAWHAQHSGMTGTLRRARSPHSPNVSSWFEPKKMALPASHSPHPWSSQGWAGAEQAMNLSLSTRV